MSFLLVSMNLIALRTDGTPLATGIPPSVIWFIALAILTTWILMKTRYGNWIFASGGDKNGANNVGVPVGRVKISLAPIKVQKANPNKPIIVDDGGTDGGAGGSGGSGGGGSSGHGTGTGSGTGGSGNKSAARDKLILKGQRIWKSGPKHRLSFTVEEAFEGTIQVFEVGMVGH